MKFWIRFLLLIALIGLAFWIILRLPQDIFITWGTYEVYTNTPLLLTLLIIFLLLWSVLLGGWRWIISLPSRWSLWWGKRQHQTGKQLVLEILLAFEEDDLKKAEKFLQKSDKYFDNEPFIFFLKFTWAHRAGDLSREKEALDRLSTFPGGVFFHQKQQIEKAITRQDHKEATLILEELMRQQKGGVWACKELLPLYIEQEKFSEAEGLLNKMSSLSFPEELLKKERARFLYAQALSIRDDLLQQESLLRKAHLLDSHFSEAAVQLAHVLGKQKKEKQARAILETTWRHTPHPDIATAYKELDPGELPTHRFRRLQGLIETNPSHPLSYWVLGQAALEAQLWLPAREYLMHLVVKKPQLAYPLLAQLEQQQHQDWQAACQWLEKGYTLGAQQ